MRDSYAFELINSTYRPTKSVSELINNNYTSICKELDDNYKHNKESSIINKILNF